LDALRLRRPHRRGDGRRDRQGEQQSAMVHDAMSCRSLDRRHERRLETRIPKPSEEPKAFMCNSIGFWSAASTRRTPRAALANLLLGKRSRGDKIGDSTQCLPNARQRTMAKKLYIETVGCQMNVLD